ncbi:unnamed protein product [Urochloa humidicola]
MAAAAAPAAGAGKGKRKRPLSEDDVYLLLHRYAPGTILTALQEVAQHAEAGKRINWKAMVGKSATGITSAREYQMLWRHFAYNHDLDETVDAGEQPLGDDSDLELEIEPVPNPTQEALSEASALAKALISGSSREQASGQRNLDAPVLDPQNEKIVRVPSEKQLGQNNRITNVTGPVSNSKQASHLGPSGSLDPNGPSKKKKKPKAWSKEEDADLAAGVQKFGEGNWDYIFHKCKFDNTRTPDQLSQRWALICKRPGGGSTKPASTKHATIASSEALKNAQKAISMAVGPIRKTCMIRPGPHQQGIQHKSAVFAPNKIPEVKSVAAPSPALAVPVPVPVPMPLPVKVQVNSPLPQEQQEPVQHAPPKLANASNKTRKKQAAQPNPTICAVSSIQQAAFAAGARLATAATAAKFIKDTSARIRSQVTGSSKSSASLKASSAVVELGTQSVSTHQHLETLNTSAPKSCPSVLTTHATEQVHCASEVAVVNPPGPSAGAHLLETKEELSTTPVPGPCDSEEKEDDSTFCVITIDDLFPEDANQPEIVDEKAKQPVEIVSQRGKQLETADPNVKQPETADPKTKQPETTDPEARQPETADTKAKQPDTLNPKVEMVDPKDKDMLEFDQFVASQGSVNTDHLDKSKTGRSGLQAQGPVGSEKKQVKLVPTVGKGNPASAGVPATAKRTKTPVPHLMNPVPAGTPRGIVGTVNANAPNKTLVRKASTLAPAGVQAPPLKKQAVNVKGNQVMQPSTAAVGSGVPASTKVSETVKGNQVMQPSTAAVGSGVPASSLVSVTVNGASKVNPPPSTTSAQASTVVNIGSKVNPTFSGQASTVVNIGSKGNPPSIGQASTVVNIGSKANRPSSGQASTVLNIGSKGNPPSIGQASVVLNVGSKANPPSSGQANTVLNIGSKVNQPSSGQASAKPNAGSKANPPSKGQASVAVTGANRAANQLPSSQAGTASSGAANKANPPGAPKQ